MNLAELTAGPCFDVFAEPITWAGDEVRGIPSNQVVELGGYEGLTENRMTVSVLLAEVPVIEKGQAVVIQGKAYQVDEKFPGTDDGVTVKVLLR